MLINCLKLLPRWLKAVLGIAIAAFIAFLVGGIQTMPLDKSWIPSITLFVLAGIALVITIVVIIYSLRKKGKLRHELKDEKRLLNEKPKSTTDLTKSQMQEGSLDNVSQQDRLFINSLAFEMARKHGHMDLQGLLADRASGVALKKLMTKKCSRCNSPRSQFVGFEGMYRRKHDE